MSRDFKQEYEQHMIKQTPDLWSRIEANIPVKEAPTVNGAEAVGFGATGVAAETSNIRPMNQRKGISRRRMTYAMTAAAALLICVLAVPVLRSAQGGMADSANFMAKDATYEICVEEAADAGEAENGSGMYSANGAPSEATMQEAECEVADETPEKYTMADGASGSQKTETKDDTENATTIEVITDVKSTADGAVAEGAPISDVEVTVLEMFEENGKVLYRAELVGQEVILVFGEEFSDDASLLVGEKYELMLEAAGEDVAWDYVIVGM